MFKVFEEGGENLQSLEEGVEGTEDAAAGDRTNIAQEWNDVCRTLTETREKLNTVEANMDGKMENLSKIVSELQTSVQKLQDKSEEADSLSQTLLMLYQENSEEIRNLQSGFHEIGNKTYEKQQSKDEQLGNLVKEQEEKFKTMNEEWNEKFDTLEKELRRIKSRQENAILDAMRSSMECMVCLETPTLPLYVCSQCSKMIGCLKCCSQLQTCANCRADLPGDKQPLRGLEVLSLILKSEEQS